MDPTTKAYTVKVNGEPYSLYPDGDIPSQKYGHQLAYGLCRSYLANRNTKGWKDDKHQLHVALEVHNSTIWLSFSYSISIQGAWTAAGSEKCNTRRPAAQPAGSSSQPSNPDLAALMDQVSIHTTTSPSAGRPMSRNSPRTRPDRQRINRSPNRFALNASSVQGNIQPMNQRTATGTSGRGSPPRGRNTMQTGSRERESSLRSSSEGWVSHLLTKQKAASDSADNP